MGRLYRYLLICVGLFLAIDSSATHIVGADMSYRNIGGNTFEFTINVFRDCEGIPVQPVYRIDYASLSCNIQGTFDVNMIPSLTKEVSAICPYIPTICTGGVQDGIQQYVFKGTFTLPQACTDWVFSWRECNRNHDITTIANPDAQCLYIESTLNSVVAPTNSSPTFNNPPVSILCINQINSLNPGTAEIDGDDMTFSAVTPKTGKFKDVTYLAPFSAGSPVTNASGYSVNSTTGDIVITPTVVDEVTVVAERVQEFRNGVLVGSTLRDIQIITKDCNNNNPILSGIDKTTSDTKTVCAGNQVCFEIFGSDLDPGQKLTMNWDYAIDTSRAKFEVSGDSILPKGRFCWNTLPSDSGLYFFTVTIRDDFCPNSGITTKAYKIIVTPAPKMNFASPVNIPCNTTTLLNPAFTSGTPPYLYKWSTGASTPTITVGSGTYTIVVTDSKGCKLNRQIEVRSGVSVDFLPTKICASKTVNFQDLSSSLIGTINSWSWDFGEPSSGPANFSSLQNPSHVYAAGGSYNVKLVITDDTGCKDSIVKKVRVCGTPIANFSTYDSCQQKPFIYITDQSIAPICGIKSIQFTFGSVSGGYSSPPGPIYFPPGGITFQVLQPDSGWINLTYTIINEDSCVSTISRMIHVNPRPNINVIQNSYYFNCSRPDTILTAVIDPTRGKPPFVVTWNNGTSGLSNPVNKPGVYSATVTDAKGCIHTDGLVIMDPLVPEFDNDPYCELTDVVKFNDNTFSHWGAIRWDWNFGDGATFSTTNPLLRHPTHVYAAEGLYKVVLTVYDSKGCVDSAVHNFVFVLPDNHFVVQPSPFCIGQLLTLESPRGLYIDSLVWSFGNGDKIKGGRQEFTKVPNPPLPASYYYFDNTYVYGSGSEGSTYPVSLQMKYNNNQCIRNYSTNVTIFPAFDVEIDSMIGNQCSGDTVQFFASLKVGSPVVSWNWEFRLQDNIPPYTKQLVSASTDHNPKMTFDKNGNYFATLRARNADGCEEVIADYGFPIVKLPKPAFCIDNPCVDQQTKFFYFCSNFPEVSIDSVHWSFGDGQAANVQEPFNIYADSGLYNVKCEIFNTAFGCSNDTTMSTRIYLLPTPDFLAAPVCLGQLVNFDDLSTPSYLDTLERWSWDFGDGNIFSTTDSSYSSPTHLYGAANTYQVSLYVESKISKCVDTISKSVTVYPNPIAGFSVTENELVLNHPILFVDESIDGVRWLWKYGDGDSLVVTDPLNRNNSHTYTGTQRIVTITQVVYNEFGCTDTATKVLDLSIHLILPTAFSPNGNGQNDKFKLIYKGIASLEKFEIFNRWGEKIFDANGDLEAGWDGTYKGKEQPLGVYVYSVKALDFSGEEIVLSGKVTLIR